MAHRYKHLLRPLLTLSLLLSLTSATAAIVYAQDPFVLPRLDGAIRIDGISDEPAWERVPPLPLLTYQPTYGAPPREPTEIRIAYDDTYLYVSGRLYDSNTVRANSLYRDRYSGDDTFAVILDTFNDNETALWFFTTPAGVRFDMAVSNDAEFSGASPFGGVINDSWNTFWDVATVVTDEGWFAEMRIPYSSLGFQDQDGQVIMGLTTYRYIARTNERYIFPDIPPDFQMGFAKPSLAQDIRLNNVKSQNPVYITPYIAGGLGQANRLNDLETAYLWRSDPNWDVGGDIKYNLTSNLTLDLTVNTDFAQVEADDQQVNLTRFSLFFPEKRQFFQERAGIFEFTTGQFDRLFHSRQIGLSDGDAVPILGGTRLVGRVGDWDVGLIDMQTARIDGLPSENFGVIRLRRQVLNDNSYAGGIFTSRITEDGAYNLAYGLDGVLRVTGNEYLTLKWAQSLAEQLFDTNQFDFAQSGLMRALWQRRGQQGLTYQAGLTWTGGDYNPGIGFVTRQDVLEMTAQVAYGWFAPEASRLRRIAPSVAGTVFFRNEDGTIESLEARHSWRLETKSGSSLTVSGVMEVEDLRESLALPENTDVPPGRYVFAGAGGFYNMSFSRLLRTNAQGRLSTFYDGWRFDIGAGPTWNLSRHVELGGDYAINVVRFPDRNQAFEAHIARLRMQLGLNTRMSANAFLQYSSVGDVISTNIRFRYNFREGNDLWLVYNEGLNTDRHREALALPTTISRTFLLKYTYTFRV